MRTIYTYQDEKPRMDKKCNLMLNAAFPVLMWSKIVYSNT